MDEAKVKVEIELPKEAVHIEGQDEKEKDSSEKTQPKPATESEISKLQKELAERRKRFEETAPLKTDDSTMAPPLDRLPVIQDKRPPNNRQKMLIAFGLAIIVVGFILWPLAGFWLAFFVVCAGALAVATGTLVKI